MSVDDEAVRVAKAVLQWDAPSETDLIMAKALVQDDVMSIERAVRIGHELEGIAVAIDQGQVGFMNADPTRAHHDFYETPLFVALSARRETLRHELLRLEFK